MKTNSEKIVIIVVSVLSFILAPVVSSASLSLKIGSLKSGDQSIEIPISADRCEGLGALQFNFTYDAAVVEPTSVESGSDLSSGLVEFEIKSPGNLRVAMISSNPVKGSGELLKVIFKRVSQEEETSGFALSEVIAWDHETNTEMFVTHEAGALILTKKSGLIPDNLVPDHLKMPLIIGGIVLILLILIILIVKKLKGAKKCNKPAASNGAFCPECGSPHATDAKFCPKCGQAIPPTQ